MHGRRKTADSRPPVRDPPASCTLAPGPASPELPDIARRIARAIACGRAPGLLPPLVALRPGPDGGTLAVPQGDLSGPDDARALLAALSTPAFAPFHTLLAALDTWRTIQAPRFADALAPRLLDPCHGGVYGDLLREAFVRCAGAHAVRDDAAYLAQRRRAFCAAMERFLERLQRDLRGGRLRALGARGRAIALAAHGDETHNGFERVLRVGFRGGVALAYKARPADGERLLLREGGLFDALQRLPPAAEPFRLPQLPSVDGADGDCLWCEWIAAPQAMRTLRRVDGWCLRGPRFPVREARRFWRDAGALAATCFGFGIADLYAGNLRVGVRRGFDVAMPYPVDPEVCFAPAPGLRHTGLVGDAADSGNHHVGFERRPRFCTADTPLAGFVRDAGGRVQLRRLIASLAREETVNVVGDSRGGIGYAPHLAPFFRGMFDVWATLCTARPAIDAWLRRHARGARTRVLRRSSEVYATAMDDVAFGAAPAYAGFDAAERAQLRRGDLPAFYRRASGGPLCWIATDRDGRPHRRALRCDDPAPLSRTGLAKPPEFVDLAIALRDAVAYVFRELGPTEQDDRALGVRLRIVSARRGEAAFDWPQQGHRLLFGWHGDRLRLRAERLPPTAAERAQLRARLLRIDRIDAGLRARWMAAGFPTRGPLARELRTLERASAAWLQEVVDTHGWPGHALVGARAADAACRLVQHLRDEPAFQRRCLRLLRAAVAAGDVPAKQPAYLEDALCVQAGRPQRYGTKLRRVDGVLVPYSIRGARSVDARRAAVGLQPMANALARARRRIAAMERET